MFTTTEPFSNSFASGSVPTRPTRTTELRGGRLSSHATSSATCSAESKEPELQTAHAPTETAKLGDLAWAVAARTAIHTLRTRRGFEASWLPPQASKSTLV
eukprot:scaffold7358_cov252-Pinguiococcus_pyrenoidosus.AAC.7